MSLTPPIYPENAVILAPLAGYTDLPYRRSCRRHGCAFAFTEMVDAGCLSRQGKRTKHYLERGDDELWLGVQLVGYDLNDLLPSVDVINQHDFSVLDFNLGCPAPKVIRRNKGAALARQFDEAARVFEAVARRSRFPTTAKFRIQDETDPEPTIQLASKLAQAGAVAMTIHGRLMEKGYSGPSHPAIIAAVRASVKTQIVLNGGIMDAASFHQAIKTAGAGPVMVARGAMGNPWLFGELSGLRNGPPSTDELCAEMETHVSEIAATYGELFGMKMARKIILDYLSGRGFGGTLKKKVSTISNAAVFTEFMTEVRKGPKGLYSI